MKSKIKNFINHLVKIFLVFVPTKKLRAKLKADWTKFYIKKYVKIAVKNYVEKDNKEYEKNPPIYQYWEQGIETAPKIIKTCTSSIDKFEPDSKHIILDKNNIEDYVEIPSFIYDLKNQGKMKTAQFSDILRSCLLAQGPCAWVDATILLTNSFPNYIKDNDFFMFKGLVKTPEQFAGANYFIYSKTPNKFTTELQNAIIEYWKDNDFLVTYFTHPHYISLLAKENKEFWDKIPTKDEKLTLMLSEILFDEFNKEKFEEIKNLSSVHKATYKIPNDLKIDIEKTYFAKIRDGENA